MATDDIIEKLEAMSMKAGPSRPRPAAKPKAPPIPYQPTSDPSTDEQTSVHDVYEAIAPHFSLTRYKPWPMIASFLASIPAGSIGLDSGAGNGKYIPSARANGLEMIPMDRSEGLLGFAKSIPAFYAGRGEEGEYWRANEDEQRVRGEAVRGDLTARCWRQAFDFAISIAAIHHLSTPARRVDSIGAIVSTLIHTSQAPYSSFLLYVWAYEQGKLSRRNIGIRGNKETKSVRAMDKDAQEEGGLMGKVDDAEEGNKLQDIMVPWVVKVVPKNRKGGEKGNQTDDAPASNEGQVYHRYYHLFIDGELQDLVEAAAKQEGYNYLGLHMGGDDDRPIGSENGNTKWLRLTGLGWEMDNWWVKGQVGVY